MFDINEMVEAVNSDIVVIFTPDSNVKNYKYSITYNNDVMDYIVVENNNPTTITLNQTGSYTINVKTYNQFNKETSIDSGIYNIDKEKPILEISDKTIEFVTGTNYNFKEDAKAYDNLDGDITSLITTNEKDIDFSIPGIKTLTYEVSDKAGNIVTDSISVNVIKNNEKKLMLSQGFILLLLFSFILIIMKYRHSIKLERRLAPYTVEPLKDNSLSIFDSLSIKFEKIIKKISFSIKKSVFIQNYSKKYNKYINIYPNKDFTPLDFISFKIFMSLLFLIIALLSKTIQYEVINLYELSFPLFVGFFTPDIIYFSKYKIYRNKIENDLLQAIIIMNNAFKSGRSITQAILLVTKQLDGPIAEDFKKMHLELSFGLSIEIVFQRFAERIKLEEVTYLTASLSILNQTGGNIIKVFSSIEKSLFNKKKLKLELESLTGSSKIIVYVLFAVPALFVLFISIINPSYFLPLFTTTIGLVILSVILIMYVVYIFVVKKVMKVRM